MQNELRFFIFMHARRENTVNRTVADIGPVIGLEVHAQLLTESKLFCGCRNEYGAPPNSLTCPVCLGYPGALPTINKRAAAFAVKMILAVGGRVNRQSLFARKNYFYPDLPKGYQISQYDQPLGIGGSVRIDLPEYSKDVPLIRIHLEEDAGKSIHPEHGENHTRLDFNRCGVPLIEIVTQPEIASPQEAHVFLRKLRQIVQYLEICSGDMEKGALRCDANVSIRPNSGSELGVRTELKNMNSIHAVERALTYEIERQTETIRHGDEIVQETRLWNETTRATEPMRGKEESDDYRYFPEPDLPSLIIESDYIENIRRKIPEMPDQRRNRIMREYGIPEYDAAVLTESKAVADYYELVAAVATDNKLAANWMMGEVLRVLNESAVSIDEFAVKPKELAELVNLVVSNVITGSVAKEIFSEMVDTGRPAAVIVDEKNLRQISDAKSLTEIVDAVLRQEARQVESYRHGKTRLFDYFVGQVMKATKGRANPEMVRRILEGKLHGG